MLLKVAECCQKLAKVGKSCEELKILPKVAKTFQIFLKVAKCLTASWQKLVKKMTGEIPSDKRKQTEERGEREKLREQGRKGSIIINLHSILKKKN